MNKSIKLLLIGFAIFAGVTLCGVIAWLRWQSGVIVAQASLSEKIGSPVIKVRMIPFDKNPVWMFMPLYSRFYRCEFYRGASSRFYSSQSFSEDSYIADIIAIQPKEGHVGTVFFDGTPKLLCRNGWWEQVAVSD